MSRRSTCVLPAAVVLALVATGISASHGVTTVHAPMPAGRGSVGPGDWPLHNLNLSNNRYSELTDINSTNVSRLTLKWSFEAKEILNSGQMTPLVIDGVMYFNSGPRLMAVNAETGAPVWTFQGDAAQFPPFHASFSGHHRGPAYADGRIYAASDSIVYAVDARTGKLVESFGDGGLFPAVNRALQFKYPKTYSANVDSMAIGYFLTSPPAYHNGVLYVAAASGDNHINGGLLIAADGVTGKVKWVFSTIPQGPDDEGWAIAKETWSGGARAGGGIWTQPAIDPTLGKIYFNAGNPSPAYDGSVRKGINLFTNSTIALELETGKLSWHFQTVHHDLWDLDFVNGPLLFDVNVGGRTVKGIGAAGKTCYMYAWDRETGKPINPIIETAVPTTSDLPGEQVWPSQPIPYTAAGAQQQPFCATLAIVSDPGLADRVRPIFTPYSTKAFYIVSPGQNAGAAYGAPSFSPRTGLMYITGKNSADSSKIRLIGDSARSGPGFKAFRDSKGESGPMGMKQTGTLTAYDPATGLQKWRQDIPTLLTGGNLVTAGNLVFQGSMVGDYYAFDATTGTELFKSTGNNSIRAEPITYRVNGKQFVAVVASHKVIAFGMP